MKHGTAQLAIRKTVLFFNIELVMTTIILTQQTLNLRPAIALRKLADCSASVCRGPSRAARRAVL